MSAGELTLLTWNVNGLRSVVSRAQGGLKQFLERDCAADIVCLQETKIRRAELSRDVAVADGWESFWSFCQPGIGTKTGYSGVATFCRTGATPVCCETGLTGSSADPSGSSPAQASTSPLTLQLSQELGLSIEDLQLLDHEGRALVTDHGVFLLVNLYGPALSIEERFEERLAFKLNFYKVLEWRIRKWVSEGRAVIVVGDLNISPHPIDSCKPHPVSEFVRRPDRQWLVKLLEDAQLGLTDAFRVFHPHREQAYTCWNTASGARVNNYGTRIDHILVAGPAPQQLAAALQHPPASAPAAAADAQDPGLQPGAQASAAAPGARPLPAATSSLAAGRSVQLLAAVTNCDIRAEQQGSDHCPVWCTLAIPPQLLPTGHAPPAGAGSKLFPGKQASLTAWLQQSQQQLPSSQVESQQDCQGPLGAIAAPEPRQGSSQHQHQQQQAHEPGGAAAAAAGQASNTGAVPGASQGHPSSSNSGISSAAGKRPGPHGQAGGSKRQRAGSKAPNGKGGAGQLSLRSFFGAPSPSASQPPPGPTHGSQQQQQAGAAQQQPAAAAAAAAAGGGSGWPHLSPHQYADAGASPTAQEAAAAGSTADMGEQPSAWQQQPQQLHPGNQHQHQHQQQQQQLEQQQQPQEQGMQPPPQQQAGPDGDGGAAQAAVQEVQQALAAHQQATRAAWQRISNSMKPPLCRKHKEPCVMRTVKKGDNVGKRMWVCARPDGPDPVGSCGWHGVVKAGGG